MNPKTEISKKTCAITGCSSGIGLATAIELAKQGYQILMIVRNNEKSEQAFQQIKQEGGQQNVIQFFTDLSSIKSIKKTAEEIKKRISKIDILINNAGVFTKKYQETEDGIELTIAVNYLATFILTNLLLPVINKQSGKIINLSSELYKKGKINPENLFKVDKFNGDAVYAASKLMVNYFTFELANRLEKGKISVNCVHPGVVGTEIFREYPKWFNFILNLFLTKPETGAKPILNLALNPKLDKVSGKYFNKTKENSAFKYNSELSRKIWEKSVKVSAIKN